jgi:hypothetical protein
MGRISIASYRPKPGQEAALDALLRDHVPILRSLGLATGREPIAGRAADGTVVEVFEWVSEKAIEDAHANPDVLAMWAKYEVACEYVSLASLPECQGPFANFDPV